METSWSSRSNYYGWSWFSDVPDALTGYTNEFVNATYGGSYTAIARNETWGTLTWNMFCAEIDNDQPVILLVDSDGDGGTDHFVTAIGYRDTNGYPEYACFDTWSTGVRWERFRAMSTSYTWGIYGATCFSIESSLQQSVFPVLADTWVRDDLPDNNYCTDESLVVGILDDGALCGAYLRSAFDIPAGAEIVSATLRLWKHSNFATGNVMAATITRAIVKCR